MIKNLFLLTLLVCGLVFWTKAIQARFTPVNLEQIDDPVVIELFTSQGCSSCPPADRLLGEISANKNIIPLSFHVTYWDRLGWPDTLGREFSTKRQRSYAAFKKSRRVYTPQMVVNGGREFVGSDRASLSSALNAAPKIQSINIDKTAQNVLTLTLPEIPEDGSLNYMIRLFGVKSENSVKIQRGENRGRDITYHNAVLYEQPIGAWLGDSDTRIVKIPTNGELNDIDKLIVVAQKGGFGEIVAVGQITR